MAQHPQTKAPKTATKLKDYGVLGVRAAQAGQFETAIEMLEKAVSGRKPSNSDRFNLAVVCEQVGEMDRAAQLLTQILRAEPRNLRAAQRLSSICRRFNLSDIEKLDPYGLKAALAHPATDAQTFASVVLAWLKTDGAFSAAITDPNAAAESLNKATPKWMSATLFIDLLESSLCADPELERLLTSLRRKILHLPDDRFADKTLVAFAVTLAHQCERNEHVFATNDHETAAADAIIIDLDAIRDGDRSATTALLKKTLYTSVTSLFPPTATNEATAKIRPPEFRNFIQQQLASARDLRQRITHIARHANDDSAADAVSQRVARQYEVAPYPRWEAVEMPESGWMGAQLRSMLTGHPLDFLDAPFDVLIAGAGTGRQAIHSANAFGPHATVLATDLSASSLGYAQAKAEALGVTNLSFLQQNILDLDPVEKQFDVIECLGVLHHMADPLAGWRKLIACLKEGGLMQIALYSKISRKDIIALREASDHPGPDCTNAEARAYRAKIASLPDDAIGGTLKHAFDFYTMSTFRDLMLHQSEQQFTLGEIADFLDEENMQFLGFVIDPVWVERFQDAHPDETRPGSLQGWAAFEEDNPELFNGMYQFYCARKPA